MNLKIKNKVIEFDIDENNCWNVKNCAVVDGYTYAKFNGVQMGVHRAFYIFNILKVDSIPREDFILHSCDNKKCINPQHLRIGNAKDNKKDEIERCETTSFKGKNNPKAKLTEKDVLSIRSFNGFSNLELSELFGVDRRTIGRIKNNKIWKHLK